MGKKGAALRAEKAKKATYNITDEWLENHDRELLERYEKRREDLFQEAVAMSVPMFLAMSVLVLVRDFGWGRIRSEKDNKRRRIARFCQEVSREFEKVFNDPEFSDHVDDYVNQVWEYTGVEIETK